MRYYGVNALRNFIVQTRKIDAMDDVSIAFAGVVVAYKDPLVDGSSNEVTVENSVAANGCPTHRIRNNPFEVVTVALRGRDPTFYDPPATPTFSNVQLIDVTTDYTISGNTVAVVTEGSFTSSIGFSNSTSNNAVLDSYNIPVPVVTTTSEANTVTITGSGKILVFNFELVQL